MRDAPKPHTGLSVFIPVTGAPFLHPNYGGLRDAIQVPEPLPLPRTDWVKDAAAPATIPCAKVRVFVRLDFRHDKDGPTDSIYIEDTGRAEFVR